MGSERFREAGRAATWPCRPSTEGGAKKRTGPSAPTEAAGVFLDREYTFECGGAAVATVSKRWFTLTDTYGVDIAPGEDDVLILAATVVIDLACHGDSEQT